VKKLFSVTVALALLCLAVGAQASVSVYTDRSAWEAAVSYQFEEEFFSDATLNPGVSVVSTYPGYIDTTNEVWWDRLVKPGSGATTTTWGFDTSLVGYGGNWDPATPGGTGAGIAVSYSGSWAYVGEIPNSYTGEFWGFVSSEPFSAVLLESGSQPGYWCETYELDNMVYSAGPENAIPEASSITLFAGGLASLFGLRRRRS